MNDAIIRPAQSDSAEDAHAFARFAEMAGDDLYTQMLGGKAKAILARMFAHPGNINSFQHVRFVMVDDQIAGMLSAYTGAQSKAQRRRTSWLFLRYGTWRMLRLTFYAILMSRVFDFMDKVEDDAYYLQMVAVASRFRGRGLSKHILAEAENAAHQTGCDSLALDVDIHNEIAIAAYQSYGFHIAASSPVLKFGDDEFAVHRMVMPLSSSS